MHLETLVVKNYKALRNVEIRHIPKFMVVVGANGSGKTTLFDVFGFLRDCLNTNVRQALDGRGRFREVVSRGRENDTILFELQLRMEIAGKQRLVTYHLEIAAEKDRVTVKKEFLRYKRARYGAPYYFMDFTDGAGHAISNEEDFDKPDEDLKREYQTLESPDILAIKGLGQFQRFKAANALRQLLENWHVSDFYINAMRGRKEAIGSPEHLSVTGDNLQLVARHLYEHQRETFDDILEKMKRRVPGISGVEPELTADGYLILRFQDGSFKTPFLDRYMSDGTIRMFAYLMLLHDPKPHALLCIEEPENQLYPKLMRELAEEFREYSKRGGQVFVSTHSPDLLNAARVEEVFWLAKRDGATRIYRASEDKQIQRYVELGDQLGSLWKQGFFDGADPQ